MAAATPKHPRKTLPLADAATAQGVRDGWGDFSTAAEGEFNLSSLPDGGKIRISCSGQGFWVCFMSVTATSLVLTDQSTQTAGVPELIPANSNVPRTVPANAKFLRYKPVTGTGDITVTVPA